MNRFTQLPCQVADANVSVSSARPWFKTSVITSVVLSATLLSACGSSGSSSTPDTTAPVVTLTGASALTQAYGETYVEQGASAQDDIDGDVAVVISGDVDVNTISEYTVTYEATDAAGNVASEARIVTVADLTAPVITLLGGSVINVNVGDDYEELGATALDNLDGDVDVVISGAVDVNEVNAFTLTYEATDAAGNTSSINRTVNVLDVTAPVVTLIGESAIELAFGEVYQELGANALDDVDGAVEVVVSGDVDVNVLADYTVTYQATDAAGNAASTQRTVTIVDNVAPIITLEGETSIELGQGRDYIERGATADDNVDGELTVTNIIGGDFDTTVLGTYQVTYQISDGAGNESETVTRSIEVVEPRPFIFTYQTTEDNEDFTPRLDFNLFNPTNYAYDYSVDWGDGTVDENLTDAITHTYAEAGVYTVSINGTLATFSTDDSQAENYLSVEQWGDIKWLSVESFLGDAANLVGNATDTPDLRLVTSLRYMFGNAHNFNSDISQWQVGHIISFETMFLTALAFNQDISAWDVSSAESYYWHVSMAQINSIKT